jgi:hypothetical protein
MADITWRSNPCFNLSTNGWTINNGSISENILSLNSGGTASLHVGTSNTHADYGKIIVALTSLNTSLSTELEKNVVVTMVFNFASGLKKRYNYFPSYRFESVYYNDFMVFDVTSDMIASIDINIVNSESETIEISDCRLFLNYSNYDISNDIAIDYITDFEQQLQITIPDLVLDIIQDEDAQELIQDQIDDTTEPIKEDVVGVKEDVVGVKDNVSTLKTQVDDIQEIIDSGSIDTNFVIPAIDDVSEMADLPEGAMRIVRSYTSVGDSVSELASRQGGFY